MKQNAQEFAATIRRVIFTCKWKHRDLEMIQQRNYIISDMKSKPREDPWYHLEP